MTCKKYGRQLMQDAKFCDVCGTEVVRAELQADHMPEDVQEANTNKKYASVRLLKIAVVLAAIALLFPIVIYVLGVPLPRHSADTAPESNAKASGVLYANEQATPAPPTEMPPPSVPPEATSSGAEAVDRYTILVLFFGELTEPLDAAVQTVWDSQVLADNNCDIQLDIVTVSQESSVRNTAVQWMDVHSDDAVIICDPDNRLETNNYYDLYQWMDASSIPVLIVQEVLIEWSQGTQSVAIPYGDMLLIRLGDSIPDSFEAVLQITINILKHEPAVSETEFKILDWTEGIAVAYGDIINATVSRYTIDPSGIEIHQENVGTGDIVIGTGMLWPNVYVGYATGLRMIGGFNDDVDAGIVGHSVGETFELHLPHYSYNSANEPYEFGEDIYSITINGIYR